MDRDTYKKAFEKIKVSEDCIKGVLNMSFINEKKVKSIKFRWIVPAVVIVVMMSGITAAAYGLDIGNMFRSYFEDDTPLSENQLEQIDNAGVELLATATDNGTTLNVKAAVGDNNTAYILFDVIAPEDTVLGEENYEFEGMSFFSNDIIGTNENSAGGMCVSVVALKDDNLTDNKKSFMGEFHAANIDLQNKDIELDLQNLAAGAEKAEDKAVITGNWNLEFKLGYNTPSKEFEVNKLCNYNGVDCNVIKIGLSSISAYVEFKGGTADTFDGTDGVYLTPELIVNLKDGTSFTTDNGPGGCSDDVIIRTYSFGKPIDISTVKSITLGDLEIPIE